MMEFSSLTDIDSNNGQVVTGKQDPEKDSRDSKFELFSKNLLGAINSEQTPYLSEIVVSGIDLAKNNEWDAATTIVFIKEVVEIYINAQVDFARSLSE